MTELLLGQDKLLEEVNKYTIESFPKSVLILGEEGAGKHTLLNYISDKFNIKIEDITSQLDSSYLLELYLTPTEKILVIQLDELTEKEQNTVLKFLEEPPYSSYVILLATNKSFVLDTILNRCVLLELAPYSKEVLALFLDEENKKYQDIILEVCNTPGKIKNIYGYSLNSLNNLCENVVSKISEASFQNALSIINKLNFSNEYDKIDADIFLMHLLGTYNTHINNSYRNSNNTSIKKLRGSYFLVKDTIKKINKDKRLNKQNLIELLLINLWGYNAN